MPENSPVKQITNDPFGSVRIPEFRNLMLGRFTFIMSLRMMATLVGWWVYELTGDPFAIGLVGLSEFFPAFFFALYSGHVIDNSEKRKMLLRGVSLYACIAILLFLLSTGTSRAHIDNRGITYIIYALIFCTGIIRSFTGPVFSAVLANVVPRNLLQNATTWSQGSWLSASVTGHALGGFLIALIGISGTLVIICLSQIIALIVLFQLKPKPSIQQAGEKKTWESVKEGLRFVFKTKEILGAFSLDMFAVLFGGAVAMVPVYAKDILKIGPMGFGWLNAAIDIGAIFIIILLTVFPMKKAQGKK